MSEVEDAERDLEKLYDRLFVKKLNEKLDALSTTLGTEDGQESIRLKVSGLKSELSKLVKKADGQNTRWDELVEDIKSFVARMDSLHNVVDDINTDNKELHASAKSDLSVLLNVVSKDIKEDLGRRIPETNVIVHSLTGLIASEVKSSVDGAASKLTEESSREMSIMTEQLSVKLGSIEELIQRFQDDLTTQLKSFQSSQTDSANRLSERVVDMGSKNRTVLLALIGLIVVLGSFNIYLLLNT
jgi:uncharacterized protein YoxC